MSATLRHDIPTRLGQRLDQALEPFKPHYAKRWAGFGRVHRDCITFAIKLPRQLGDAMRLIKANLRIHTRSSDTLHRKLVISLGMPWESPVYDDEKRFVHAIIEEPDDLANWMAYSDWLVDVADQNLIQTNYRQRAELIAALLAPKAVKVKYGVPEQIRDQLEKKKHG